MSTTAALVTIGDELLAGDVENTNASWVAARLTERGVAVREIRVVPDEVDRIAAAVETLGNEHTFVVTTGGLGSTPDDITAEAVAEAVDRPIEPHPDARAHVEAAVADVREDHPGFRHDIDAACRLPADVTVVRNEEGISPGWICGNVYVLPGIPGEMRAVFERVRDDFSGSVESRVLYADAPESHLAPILADARERFAVRIGCYPTGERKRIRLVSERGSALDEAREWLASRSVLEPDQGETPDRTQP